VATGVGVLVMVGAPDVPPQPTAVHSATAAIVRTRA